jgi:hypothetical protein
MTDQIQYFDTYNNYDNLLKDIFSKLSDSENKVQYDIHKQHVNTKYKNITYVPFDSRFESATDHNIELTINTYMRSNNYEEFDRLYVNEGVFLQMLSPHHLRNKLFFPDGTKKYELYNIVYRLFCMIKYASANYFK